MPIGITPPSSSMRPVTAQPAQSPISRTIASVVNAASPEPTTPSAQVGHRAPDPSMGNGYDLAALDEWKGGATNDEDRSTAAQRIRSFVETPPSGAFKPLNLSGLGLTELPAIPEGVTCLTADDNPLRQITNFPQSLERFTHRPLMSGRSSPLESIPPLPPKLISLMIHDTGLKALPELPKSLTYLDVRKSRLTSVPELHEGLKTLVLNSTEVTSLGKLPSTLERLECNYSKLETLPPLPVRIEKVEVNGCKLTELPADIGRLGRKTTIFANGNKFSEITHTLIQGLKEGVGPTVYVDSPPRRAAQAGFQQPNAKPRPAPRPFEKPQHFGGLAAQSGNTTPLRQIRATSNSQQPGSSSRASARHVPSLARVQIASTMTLHGSATLRERFASPLLEKARQIDPGKQILVAFMQKLLETRMAERPDFYPKASALLDALQADNAFRSSALPLIEKLLNGATLDHNKIDVTISYERQAFPRRHEEARAPDPEFDALATMLETLMNLFDPDARHS